MTQVCPGLVLLVLAGPVQKPTSKSCALLSLAMCCGTTCGDPISLLGYGGGDAEMTYLETFPVVRMKIHSGVGLNIILVFASLINLWDYGIAYSQFVWGVER